MDRAQVKAARHFVETLLFIIWPFGAFISALFHIKDRYSNIFMYAFFALIGYSRKLNISDDAYHWMRQMLDYKSYELPEFLNYLFDITSLNFYSFSYHIYLYICSVLFDHTAYYWAANFFLFSLVILLIFRLITGDRLKENVLFITFLGFLMLFFFPFSSFGVRFWIAALVFVTGFYLKTLRNKKIGTFFIILSVTFHYTFIFYAAVYFFVSNTKNLAKIQIMAYAIAMFAIGTVLYVSGVFDFLNVFDDKVEGYSDTANRGEYFSSKSFFILFDRFAYTIASLLLLLHLHKVTAATNDSKILYIKRFLFFCVLSLLLLLGFYDALDRFSRVFSFMVLTFWIYLNNKGFKTNAFVTLFAGTAYLYHIMVNFVLTRSWVDLDVFMNSCFEILSSHKDVILIY